MADDKAPVLVIGATGQQGGATARHLLAAKGDQLDGALVVTSTALALEAKAPLPALEAAKGRAAA